MPQTDPGYTTAAEQIVVAVVDAADVVGKNSYKDVEVDIEGRQS